MIIKEKISKETLDNLFKNFGKMIKFVVDIEQEILSVNCDFHMECAEELTEKMGSRQKNLWGANLYDNDRIDFVALINIKPSENNRLMEIQDAAVKRKVKEIALKFLCE